MTADTDAREFGLRLRRGGWRSGLLVARNVVRAPGRVPVETLAPKTNATEFARMADCSNDRVLRHLRAWERAATAGLVPPSTSLAPDKDLDLNLALLPTWTMDPGIGVHGVYVHLAADETVLYVGLSLDVLHRTSAHKRAEWWPRVATIKIENTADRSSARALELELISTLKPLHNRADTESQTETLGGGRDD